MNRRNRTPHCAASAIRLLAVLALMLTGVFGSATAISAQAGETGEMSIWAGGCDDNNYPCIGAIFTVTTTDGAYIDSCTLEGDPTFSGLIQSCKVTVPLWTTVVVTQDVSTISPGTSPVENPVFFETGDGRTIASHWGVGFENVPATTAGTSNVSINTMIAQHGPYFDACYILVDFSNEGCDDNRDGSVTFMDVPAGTYTVHQTKDLGLTAHVPDFQITVTGQPSDGWESFETWVTHRAADIQTNHVAIQTVENGNPATDVCYVLIGFSNVGCDDNADGQVTFLDVPFGTYTVRQTADLGPNRSVDPFTVTVSDSGLKNGWVTFTANVTTTEPSLTDPVDISLVTRDPEDGHLLTGACYVLADHSNEGCDEDGDGQVTFAQIPPGTYTVQQTETPVGYSTINEFEIEVVNIQDIPIGILVRQAPEQNAPDTRNFSVILIDSRTNTRLVSDICVELVDASNVGCDEDLRDGQIDFLDVPEGDWYMNFSNLPSGWLIQVPNSRDGPIAHIDVSTDAPTHQMIFFGVYVPESASSDVIQPSAPKTWTASAQAIMCDEKPGEELDCYAQGGIVINISLASGEFLGSCTLDEPVPNPWGGHSSICTVPDMPFNTVLVARQDPSTIPAGYVPREETITLSVGDLTPGGGDQATFNFANIRSDSGSSGSTTASGGTLLMTMRGCPEGFDPNTGDFFASCTIPLDAPDASFLYHGGDGQGGMNIMWMERQYNGAYIFNAGPYTMNVSLSGLAPVTRDGYTVFGFDSVSGETYSINLIDGETREVWVFYYYWP